MKEFKHRLMFAAFVSGIAAMISGIAAHSNGRHRGPGVEAAPDMLGTAALMGLSAVVMFVLVMWFTWWGS
ncbi:hypothetical protein [Ruegeria atlantica]|uniref:hypothetical protein n=1 Tax=Ruegeria atlantica TaxID=81569 RepID=UPI0014805436|nr:hypothetical protein [Ruegeria atlantica]